jgi:hypothetical protein
LHFRNFSIIFIVDKLSHEAIRFLVFRGILQILTTWVDVSRWSDRLEFSSVGRISLIRLSVSHRSSSFSQLGLVFKLSPSDIQISSGQGLRKLSILCLDIS